MRNRCQRRGQDPYPKNTRVRCRPYLRLWGANTQSHSCHRQPLIHATVSRTARHDNPGLGWIMTACYRRTGVKGEIKEYRYVGAWRVSMSKDEILCRSILLVSPWSRGTEAERDDFCWLTRYQARFSCARASLCVGICALHYSCLLIVTSYLSETRQDITNRNTL